MKKLTILTTVILAANLLFAQGYHIDTSFYSEALQENKMVDIYFPPGYDENPDMHYSVIYYLHGWFGSQNSMNEMIGTMEYLINNGTIEPVIMVGADNSPDPFDGSMYMNSIIWGNYEDYMINDLISWVESSFRAYPSRDHRALLGISMGGYGTFRYGILHKDKFRVLAAAASQVLNLTEAVLDSTRLHVLQQNQPGPPFFYDYYNSGSTTMFMFLVYAAFAPNLNTPQTYINPRIVEWPLDENGDYIDTIVMKAKNQSIDHLIHQLYPEDSVGIFFGCGSGDASIYPCHIAFMDSLEMLGLPYEFYDHTGGHIMPAGFKQRGLIFIDSLLLPPGIPPVSCLPNGITFTTQEQIDNFQINHPNCTEIEGHVYINGDGITNLYGLNMLTSIGGDLNIGSFTSGNPNLYNLSGLEGLSSIEGNISIRGNLALTSLDGLDNLTSIAGDLIIGGYDNWVFYGNPLLSNLVALNNLTFIGGDVTITDNDALTSLDGLEGLTSIGGGLRIGGYNWLKGGGQGNDALTSLDGLVNLTSVGGYLDISENISLTSLEGLGNLTYVGGWLQIIHSALTSMDGLVKLESIGEICWIEYNDSLTSFGVLENLTSIGVGLYIYDNDALASLAGLDNVTSIGGTLFVSGNDALTSLTGLDNIEAGSITDMSITDNNLLSECHVQSVCDYLAIANAIIEIANNAEGCNDTAQVHAACLGVSIEEIMDEHDFVISPNPNNGFATLSYNTDQLWTTTIEIYNTIGNCIQSRQIKMDEAGQQHLVLDFTALPCGIYFCRMQLGNEIITKKILKH